MLFSFESLLFDENHSAVSNEKCNLKANFLVAAGVVFTDVFGCAEGL